MHHDLRRRPSTVILAVFVGLAIGAVIAATRGEPFGVYRNEGRPVGTNDFAAIRAFTRAVWSGALTRDTSSVYTLEAYERATRLWLDSPEVMAQPCGYSPTMLWVMAPFSALSGRPAFVLWSVLGVALTIWMMLRTRAGWPVLLAFTTPLAAYTVALGQTALLTTAALFYLITARTTEKGWRSDAERGAVLWLLTAKPPLAIAAGTVLVAFRRWRVLAIAVGLAVMGAAVLTPLLGWGWVRDYVGILAAYDRTRMPDSVNWAIAPDFMSNLRAALHSDLGIDDHVATTISAGAWLVALVGIVVLARRRQVSEWETWALSILAFLLLCPHVSATEELALFLVPATMPSPARTRSAQRLVVALVLVGLVLSPAIGPVRQFRPSFLFFAKIMVVAAIAATALTDRREPDAERYAVAGVGP